MKKIEIEIPIYRAKKIDSNEYIESSGIFIEDRLKYIMIVGVTRTLDKIKYENVDPTTLAIHFPDMLNSEGNKIFASLSKDGKGGDMFILGDERLKYIAMIHNNQLMAKQQNTYGSLIGQGYAPTNKWKVIGIQQ